MLMTEEKCVATPEGPPDLRPRECSEEEILEKLHNLPMVEYPEEYIRELDKEVAAAKAQIAAGELFPMTVEEFAAEVMRRRRAR